ncbi:hypothetical protein FACS1894105_02040 [Clostridia bacterium]|nr:hypothetical protein FACS1894105_02040 [Clostridia bacterium]
MKKISLLITASILMTLLASCNAAEENTVTGSTANETGEKPAASSTGTRLAPDLQEKDFGGLELTFLSRKINDAGVSSKHYSEAASEEESGEMMNDAVYKRNRYIEDKYNVSIKRKLSEDYASLQSDIKKAVDAEDNSFDAAFASLFDGANLSQSNYFVDLNTVPNLDFEKPWWDQRAVENLSVGGKLYFVTGDITPWTYEFPTAVIVNKELIQSYSLEDPYQVVRDNKWTFDKLSEYCKQSSSDLNGNGETDLDDAFGLTLANETFALMFVGGGENFTQKGSGDIPYFALSSERSAGVAEKLYGIFTDQKSVLKLENYRGLDFEGLRNNFRKGNTLFYATWMSTIVLYRDLDIDIGLLPQPKYDSAQETYSHPISDYWATVLVIPSTNNKLAETGFILEALCAESMYTVRPAYYESTFKNKGLRDENSEEMLDIILDSLTYDLGRTYDWGGIAGTIGSIGAAKSFAYSSAIEQRADAVNKAIERTMAQFGVE